MRSAERILGAALLALLALAAPAKAQVDDPAVEPSWQQGSGQDRLIKMFLDHATTELNLTVEQRDALGGVLGETMKRRAELARSQARLRRQIREALADPATSEEVFRRLSAETLSMKQREVELADWQRQRLLEVLTPRQSLRFMLLQEQLAQRIEELRRRRTQGNPRP